MQTNWYRGGDLVNDCAECDDDDGGDDCGARSAML